MKYAHALLVLLLFFVLLSCERDHGGTVATPPDAPSEVTPDTGPDPGPGPEPGPMPGVGNPLEPDMHIECVLDSGYTATSDATGRVYFRSYAGRAVWDGETATPTGTAWRCIDALPSDCEPNCEYVGEVTINRCTQAFWQLDSKGRFYVSCGGRSETDYDGDGVFDVVEAAASHVAVVF